MPISKNRPEKVSWYCNLCGEQLTAYENSSGVAKAKCKRCGNVMKRHNISPKVIMFESFLPNGEVDELYCFDEDLLDSKDAEWLRKIRIN